MSKLPLFEARTSSSDKSDVKTDLDIIAVFQDSSNKAISPKGGAKDGYAAQVDKLRKSDTFSAKHGSMQVVRFGGKEPAESVLYLGLGQVGNLTEEKFRLAGGMLAAKVAAEKFQHVVVHVDSIFDQKNQLSQSRCVRSLAEGVALTAYQFNKYKSKASGGVEASSGIHWVWVTRDKSLKTQLDLEFRQILEMAQAVNVTRNWSNEPSNHGTPLYFANEAKKFSKEYGLKYRVLTIKDAIR